MSKHLFMTSALLVTLVFVVLSSCSQVLAENDPTKSHNLIIGSRTWGDHLLQRVHVQKDYRWFRTVKDTRTLTGDGVSKITEIRVLDQVRDGSGGHASLLNGGPDSNFVTLSFKSQTNHGIDFIVEIYGKR